MPLFIVGFCKKAAVIILTGGGDRGHVVFKRSGISTIHRIAIVIPGIHRVSSVEVRAWFGRSFAIIDCTAIIDCMASITIRNLEQDTKRRLKIRAATNGRSMEQEAREILKSALAQTSKKKVNLAERIREIFVPLGGVELEPLPREPIRDPDWLAERE